MLRQLVHDGQGEIRRVGHKGRKLRPALQVGVVKEAVDERELVQRARGLLADTEPQKGHAIPNLTHAHHQPVQLVQAQPHERLDAVPRREQVDAGHGAQRKGVRVVDAATSPFIVVEQAAAVTVAVATGKRVLLRGGESGKRAAEGGRLVKRRGRQEVSRVALRFFGDRNADEERRGEVAGVQEGDEAVKGGRVAVGEIGAGRGKGGKGWGKRREERGRERVFLG